MQSSVFNVLLIRNNGNDLVHLLCDVLNVLIWLIGNLVGLCLFNIMVSIQ